jgi:hypothetical protein
MSRGSRKDEGARLRSSRFHHVCRFMCSESEELDERSSGVYSTLILLFPLRLAMLESDHAASVRSECVSMLSTPSGWQGTTNENVAPGPSLAVAQRRP